MERLAWFLSCGNLASDQLGQVQISNCHLRGLPVPGFPININQIVFLLFIRTPLDRPFQSASILIKGPDNSVVLQQNFPVPTNADVPRDDPDVRFHVVSGPVVVRNLKIGRSGRIKVWVEADGEKIYAGSLMVFQDTELLNQVIGHPLASIIAHFSALHSNAPAFADSLAPHLLSATGDFLRSLGVDTPEPDALRPLTLQVGTNEYWHFPLSPIGPETDLEVDGVPEGVTLRVLAKHSYGIHFAFEPSDVQIPNIDVRTKDPNINPP